TRWHAVAQTYADVNQMFGDIVKVTPSSKVVGDMALAMVSSGLTRSDVENPDKEIAFPDSVVGFFAGDLGQPPGGFPQKLQKKVLKGKTPLTARPGSYLAPADLEAERRTAEEATGMEIDDYRLASYLMYPKVFTEFARAQDLYGPTEVLPTPVYFYGLSPSDEILVDLEPGKTMVVQFLSRSETNDKGMVRVFFDLNGQPRTIAVPDRLTSGTLQARPKADPNDPKQVGAPMPGVISTLAVQPGQTIAPGDVLLSIEAMKMETALHAETGGTIAEILVRPGDQIDAKDLLITIG
ncbi:biotin/lipoyl-containing protein, partial [Pelagibacterium lacus]